MPSSKVGHMGPQTDQLKWPKEIEEWAFGDILEPREESLWPFSRHGPRPTGNVLVVTLAGQTGAIYTQGIRARWLAHMQAKQVAHVSGPGPHTFRVSNLHA